MSYVKELTSGTETKPGIATTEFILAVLFNAVGVLELVADPFNIPNQWVLLATAVVVGVYAASRGLAKQGSTYIPVNEYNLDPGNVEPPVIEEFNEGPGMPDVPPSPANQATLELAQALQNVLEKSDK